MSSKDRLGVWISIGIGLLAIWYVFRPRAVVPGTPGTASSLATPREDPWPEIAAAHKAAFPEGYRQDILALRRLLELRWSYREMRSASGEVDIEALEREALRVLGETPDRETFVRVLRRYVAALWDGHSAISCPGSGPATVFRMLPMVLVDVVEGVAIQAVALDLPASVDLAARDVVLAIDGVPIEEAILEAGRNVFASTAGSRRRKALWNVWSRVDVESVELRVRRGEALLTVRVPTVPIGTAIPARSLLLFQPKAEMLRGKVAYLRPGTFAAPKGSDWAGATPERREEILKESYAKLVETVAGFRGARALVLDLRGNGGGTDLLGQTLAGLLLAGEPVYYHLAGQGRGGDWQQWHSNPVRKVAGAVPFLGPVFCLIDTRTFSTADNVAACLHDVHPDIHFVGRPTGAGTGAPRSFELPNTGASVWFCTMRVRAPTSGMIEGKGVVPDYPVQWTCDDHILGRDPDLAKALELIGQPR